ncbi:uncharacterized protein LOC134254932, partial [Saccostrea cucullata]|uniref:uncharacterized protein LOC134254932 n=1 Tax=Saccostrea cuccullata TaxID=36930 RepID=UPI002ED2F23A
MPLNPPPSAETWSETVVYMDKESQLNTRYSLEFVIVVDGVILWNSTFNFISSNFVLIPVIQRMKTLPYNDLLSTGREFTSDVNLTSSQFGVYQFNVTLTSLKSGGQGAAGLLITSVTIGNTGSNVLCSAVSVYFKRSNNSRIQNVAEVTLNITNFGSPVPSATEDKDWLILKLTAIPVPVYTKLTEVHTIKINTSSVSSQFNYTIYGEVPYD